MPWTPPPKRSEKRRPSPWWQGIGFLLTPIYLGGSWVAASWLVRQNYTHQWVPVPWEFNALQQTIGLALLIFLVSFTFVTLLYGIIRGPSRDPLDVRGSHGPRPRKRY